MKNLFTDPKVIEILYKIAKNDNITKEDEELFKNVLYENAVLLAKELFQKSKTNITQSDLFQISIKRNNELEN